MDQTGSGLHKRMEALSLQASALRDALQRSEENTDSAVAALDSFDRHVSAIEASIRPAQVRAQASTMANENIDRTIETAEAILAQFEIVRRAEAVILRCPHEDLKSFLEAVDLLKGVIHFFSSNKNFKSCEGVLNQVNNLLTKSKLKIEEEFRQLMSTYSKASEPALLLDCLPKLPLTSEGNSESVGEQLSKSFESATYRTPILIPPRILPLLHDIAHQLVQDGNQQSCYRIYRDARSSALELSLQKLGIEKLTEDKMQHWVSSNVGTWTHIMHITVKVLLAGERKICDQIFDGITFKKDQCFAEVAGSSVMTLLGFGDVVAKSKRSHENLFLLLEMYGLMHGIQSEVEVIFQGNFCSGMREAALNLTKSLAQAAQETLLDLEVAVEKENSKTIVQNGNLHPFTIEVMNYVKGLFDYQSTLKILFQQPQSGSETESQLAIITMKIMQAFQNNLNGKSKQYKDPALSHIFLMNNLHYMVTFVRRSESNDILDGDWIQRHRKIVQQNANQYKRVAWAKIFQTLSVQVTGGNSSSSPSDVSSTGVSRTVIKERFKSFNMQFEDLHAKQSQWTIPDQELRDELRLAVAEVLLPAYRSFISRFGNLIKRGRNPHKYIKYSPEELDQMLGQFFLGQ
ncbi:exocyst complex component EXO70A1-like [Miscanthus floridulus]|uniref:exocyst complex component EXO70A1-like n=1 Tax=Miscanthus floridulus TaxID=154761 RepID=UPI003459FB1A